MQSPGLRAPVLAIIFNRPEKVSMLMGALAHAAPSKLYIAADGPRAGIAEEAERCAAARAAAQAITWQCEVRTLFSDTNLGVDQAVERAISWFFGHEDAGIVLEDDCLPNVDFFRFSEEMLERYVRDERIMMVSGDNFQDGQRHGNGSYYFSRYASTWGWATWKRAWDRYDTTLATLPSFERDGTIDMMFPDYRERSYWLRYFRSLRSGRRTAWDAKWMYALWSHGGLAIVPNKNLVTNIGFGADATHTKSERNARISVEPLEWPLAHPRSIQPADEADRYLFRRNYFVPFHRRVLAKLGII